MSGSIGAAFGCGTTAGAALVAIVEVTGAAAASWKLAVDIEGVVVRHYPPR